MSDDLAAKLARIEQIRAEFGDEAADAALRALGIPPPPRATTHQQQTAEHITHSPQMSLHASDAARMNVVVGVNLGTVIYGRAPDEEERRRLVCYLERLAARLHQLPLQGLEARLDQQGEGVALPHVYVMLAVDYNYSQSCVQAVGGTLAALQPYFDKKVHDKLPAFTDSADLWQALKAEYQPDQALPHQAILLYEFDELDGERKKLTGLYRALLATEAVQQHSRLVLLGAPGSGKSTFVRYLAWALAQRELGTLPDTAMLHGWTVQENRLPIILSVQKLAQALGTAGDSYTTVTAALHAELASYAVGHEDELLREALHRNAAFLLLDGLDEVPVNGEPGVRAARLATVQAIRAFAQMHPAVGMVLTCRVRAFDDTLRDCLGWHVECLAPFTLGQMRHFVPAWYGELVNKEQMQPEQAPRFAQVLLAAIGASPRLREMAQTPLLLTMMALVLYNEGDLPRDRPRLYEAILKLLLGQWDKVRAGQSLAEVIGQPDWGSDRMLPLLDRLSYAAHRTATSEDGRGRLAWGALHQALIAHFCAAGMPKDTAAAAAVRCLDYFEQRSGLLTPDGPESYVFAHLTLQEHCAGRQIILNSDNPPALVLQHRADDRWREPIFLGLGLAPPADLNDVLHELVDREEAGQPKPIARWYRDLILAAELGADRDWTYLRSHPRIKVDRLRETLRTGLAALLNDPTQPIPVGDRIAAGFLLGALGDPRYPVTPEQWHTELRQCNQQFGQPPGYWCYVQPGTYTIGGWEAGEQPANITLPAFWLARYPLTIAQYAPFVAVGYAPAAQRWWTDEGWQFKNQYDRTQPWGWQESEYNSPNQPIIGLTWYEATAFAAWLTEQLAAELPPGYIIRLPTEAEWEAAAAFAANGPRRPYPWGPQEPTPDYAIYDASNLGRPAPVGCCPAGAAVCGALDLAGNVWEWTTSNYSGYPEQSQKIVKDFVAKQWAISLRGDSYYADRTNVHCGARGRYRPGDHGGSNGSRLVLAPHSQ